MMRSYWYFAAVAMAAGLIGLGPYGAPLAVVGLALGIFFGTVSIRGHLLSPGRPNPTQNYSAPKYSAQDYAGQGYAAQRSDVTSTPPGA
jgi:hypothetical protein